ncbi:MAG: DUF2148 domain-containing protein [Candidatus Saliniplasma sp.]
MDKMKEGMDLITKLIAVAAKNSPTALDESYLDISVLDEAEKEMLVEEMYQLSDERKDETFTDKGEEIENSDRVILVGLDDHAGLGIDCKACGYENCEKMEEAKQEEDIFVGPNCVYRIIDIGNALGYAIQNAYKNNVYARISIKGGLAAKNLGLSTSRVCLAIPISLESKKKLFDF